MRKTINIDFDNSSSVILGYDPNILGPASTKFAYSTHIHGGVHLDLTNISASATSVSNGLTLALSAASVPPGANNSVYAGNNITLSTAGVSTTVSAYGLADATHDHGGGAFATGMIGGTISSNAWSLSIPGFLLGEYSSGFAGLGTSTTTVGGSSNVSMTLNTDGLRLGIPRYITTAADISHTHGVPVGINITIGSSSNALALSVADKLGTATTLVTTTGSVVTGVGNTVGLSLSFPNFITTAALSANTSTQAGTGFSSSSQAGVVLSVTNNTSNPGLSMLVPAWITTAALSANTSNYAGIGTSSTSTGGTDLGIVLGTNGLSLNVPKWITTYVPGGDWSCSTTDGSGITIITGAATHTLSYGNFLTTARASNDAMGLVTAQSNVTWTADSDGLSFDARGYAGTTTAVTNVGLTVNSLGIRVSVDTAGLTAAGDGANFLAAGSQTAETMATIVFSNSNGVSFGMSNSSVITAAHNAITSQTYQPVAISGSNTSITASTISFGNLNGLSHYISDGSLVASYTVPIQSADAVSGSNGSFTYNTLSLGASNGFTFYTTNSSIVGSMASGSLYFQDGGGVTWGAATNTAFNTTITATVVPGGGGGIALADSAATITTGAIVFSNANGISFGLAGSTMTADWSSINYFQAAYSSLLAGVSHAHGSIYTASIGGTNTNITNSSASSGLTLGIPPYAVTSHTHSVGTHTHGAISTYSTGGTATNITYSSAYNGLSLSIPPYAVTSHTHSNLYIALSGSSAYQTATLSNTFATTGHTHSTAIGSVYFSNVPGQNITFGSATAGSSTTITASAIGVALRGSGTYIHSTGTVSFANSNSITFGLSNNGTMTASFGNSRMGTSISTSGAITALGDTAGLSITAPSMGYLYFGNIVGHSWTSSVSGVSTTVSLKTA